MGSPVKGSPAYLRKLAKTRDAKRVKAKAKMANNPAVRKLLTEARKEVAKQKDQEIDHLRRRCNQYMRELAISKRRIHFYETRHVDDQNKLAGLNHKVCSLKESNQKMMEASKRQEARNSELATSLRRLRPKAVDRCTGWFN